MSAAPVVSVGVPAFNAERYIALTLESLLAQTYQDLEIIVLDNASTDGTGEICRSFERADRRVKYERNERNRGAFFNYSEVFRRSRGNLFKWASANDWCAPRFIEACVATLAARPDAVLCYPRTALFEREPSSAVPYDDNLDLQQESPLTRVVQLLQRIRLNNALNGVIRRSALARTRLHEPYYSSDVVLLAELALLGKFVERSEILFYRRMSPDTATKLMAARERSSYVFGDGAPPPRLGAWRFELGLTSLALRHGLGMTERLQLSWYLAKRLYWEGREQMQQGRKVRQASG